VAGTSPLRSGVRTRLYGREARADLTAEGLWVAVLLLGVAFLSFYRLGAGSLWDQDETKYAQVAREILETGDPITLHVNGRPWYVHPPLYMWLVAATGKIAGFSEFTVRLWSALHGVLAVYATVLLGRTLFGPRAGVLGGAVLAVTLQFLIQSRLAVFDTVLVAWMLLALHALVQGYRRRSRGDYLRFFLYSGIATLAKGPVGLVLPGLVMSAFVTVRRAWHRWREVPWGTGLLLYGVVGLSWYAAETVLHGRAFIAPVFGYYGLGRFFGVVENQAGPWYYYVPIVLLGAFPWTAFWPAAAVYHTWRLADDGSLLVVLWCVLVFVFYSLAGTKLPNYVLPVYPLAAVGVGALWDEILGIARLGRPRARPGGTVLVASMALLVLLLAALSFGVAGYLNRLYPAQFRALGHVLLLPVAVLAAGVAYAFVLAAARRPLGAFVALCCAMAATWVGILTWTMPVVEAEKPMKPLALAIAASLRPGDRIIGYRLSIYSSLIYYTDHPVEWVEDAGDLRAAVCRPGRAFVVASAADWQEVQRDVPVRSRPFAARGGILVLLKPSSASCGQAARGPGAP
jgi:4-amino-4-deoxy-L-arabinose transferase-like glycosyltransferase